MAGSRPQSNFTHLKAHDEQLVRLPESDWPDLQDRMLDQMIPLEAALKGPVQALKL